MVFLLGEVGGAAAERLVSRGLGRMWTSKTPHLCRLDEPWGFDNGAFRDFIKGQPLDEYRFLRRLDLAYRVGRPLLAVTPDIVCGGTASLEYSVGWLKRLPPEWPWHLAVQDGMRGEDVESVLPSFAGIFLGGSAGFKATSLYWCKMAHQYGKSFHYGRCGTTRKIREAQLIGCDSADSNVPVWIPGKFNQLISALETYQPDLFGGFLEGQPDPLG